MATVHNLVRNAQDSKAAVEEAKRRYINRLHKADDTTIDEVKQAYESARSHHQAVLLLLGKFVMEHPTVLKEMEVSHE